ncbi:MAG: sigma-54 dependent transcriptional regulator [Phycisphaerae bacterium]|nr:sigma-54 dependent transcriptional regulator [Phycisphaerae bacterium]
MPVSERVLVVDDEARIGVILNALLTKEGYDVKVVQSGHAALGVYPVFQPSVVLLDLMMSGMDGLETMSQLRALKACDSKVIIMTAHGKVRSAVEAMRQGAFDYLQKPFDNDELLAVIGRAIEMTTLSRRVRQLEDQLDQTYAFDSIVGGSGKIQSLFALMHKYARTDGTVLVSGESGTGKELVVHAIHQASVRKKGPFVVVNCGAIPPSLIESEFFGHEAGSFTDAKARRQGKFEAADTGTLFLDEVGDLPGEAQVKLLRVLEQREFTRVGSNQVVPVDVRVMAATNQDLPSMVHAGTFRGDLYWRLNVLSLEVCPLRERKEDISLLVHHFVQTFGTALGKPHITLTDVAWQAIQAYDWPGNVRELQNAVYSAMAVQEGQVIDLEDLPFTIVNAPDQASPEPVPGQSSLAQIAGQAMAQSEQQAILAALELTHGNKEKAAQHLGIGRKTLYRKLKQYGL